jgi:uncharacterized membrane protein YjjP (DUF1212 family)
MSPFGPKINVAVHGLVKSFKDKIGYQLSRHKETFSAIQSEDSRYEIGQCLIVVGTLGMTLSFMFGALPSVEEKSPMIATFVISCAIWCIGYALVN